MFIFRLCKKCVNHLYSFNLQWFYYRTREYSFIMDSKCSNLFRNQKKEQHVKILCHVRHFLWNSREWGCGFSLQTKCHIVLGKGGRRIVEEKLALLSKPWSYTGQPQAPVEASYPQLLKNTTWSCVIEK